MANDPNDLWPEFEEVPLMTPVAILKEQGAFLSKRTSGLLDVEITSSTDFDEFLHNFNIIARTLDYSYRLFKIKHEITLYPVNLYWGDKWHEASNEEQFRKLLADILSHESTRKILLALLAQSRS